MLPARRVLLRSRDSAPRPSRKRWDQPSRADPLTRTRRFGTGVTEGGDKRGSQVAPLTRRPRDVPTGVISLSRCSLGSGARGGAAPPGGDWRPRQSPPLFGVTGRGGRRCPPGPRAANGRGRCRPAGARVPLVLRAVILADGAARWPPACAVPCVSRLPPPPPRGDWPRWPSAARLRPSSGCCRRRSRVLSRPFSPAQRRR